MKPKCIWPIVLSLSLALPFAAVAEGPYRVRETGTDFETVMDLAKLAIQEHGMYVNNVMHMSEMLERTGKDLGMDEKLYEQAVSIEFCSAVLSRKMVAEDPRRIANCPFVLSIYVLAGRPEKTFVAYRSIPAKERESSAIMAEIADMLEAVAEGAVSW